MTVDAEGEASQSVIIAVPTNEKCDGSCESWSYRNNKINFIFILRKLKRGVKVRTFILEWSQLVKDEWVM